MTSCPLLCQRASATAAPLPLKIGYLPLGSPIRNTRIGSGKVRTVITQLCQPPLEPEASTRDRRQWSIPLQHQEECALQESHAHGARTVQPACCRHGIGAALPRILWLAPESSHFRPLSEAAFSSIADDRLTWE